MKTEVNVSTELEVTFEPVPSLYKAAPGNTMVPVQVVEGPRIAIDPRDIKGIAPVYMEDGKIHSCYMVEVPDEIGKPIMKDFEREKSNTKRKGRCKVISEKTGKLITCPSDRNCTGCPNAGNLNKENGCIHSVDVMSEMGQEIVSHGFGSEDDMTTNLEFEEYEAFLKKGAAKDTDRMHAWEIFQIRRSNVGIKDEIVWKKVGIGKTKFYELDEYLKNLRHHFM